MVCTVCVEMSGKRLTVVICLDSALWKSDLDQDSTFNPEFMETSSLLTRLLFTPSVSHQQIHSSERASHKFGIYVVFIWLSEHWVLTFNHFYTYHMMPCCLKYFYELLSYETRRKRLVQFVFCKFATISNMITLFIITHKNASVYNIWHTVVEIYTGYRCHDITWQLCLSIMQRIDLQ